MPDAPGYEWLKAIDQRDDVIRVYVDEKHETSYTRQEGLSAAARLVLNIALNYVTGGSGGIFSIAFNNFVINSISCRGDFARGAKQTFGKEGRKALARSWATKILMGDFKGSEGAGWVNNLKNAFLESMHDTIGNYLAGGIVDRDWRIDARRLGINLAAGTAAKFGAKSIGDWRKDSIRGSDNPFVDYVMHKALHGGLAAGVATATARMDHLKGPERQKHIVGAASGAMMAEVVSEYMMGAAIRRMEEKLTASGHVPSSQAYADLRRSLLADEFKTIRTVAQLSVVALAESMKVDLNAAMAAATNALDHNSAQVFLQMFAFEEAGYDVRGDGSESSNAQPRLKRSRSSEDLRQQKEIDLAEEVEDEFRNHALNSGSIWDKVLYWGSYAVDSIDGTSASSVLQARLSMRRAVKDAPKVVQEGTGILFDLARGQSVDDSRLEAYSELVNSWGPNATGLLAGFVGGKSGKGATLNRSNRAGKTGNISASERRTAREQPWTIREGQEWKEKIHGRAQKTGTQGHSFRSYREAIKAARDSDVQKVFLNRGVNRVLDEKIRPNRRPDVTILRNNGRIDQIEVPSRTDNPEKLRARMEGTRSNLPFANRGDISVEEITRG